MNSDIDRVVQAWPTRGSRAACGSLPGFMRLLRSYRSLCLCFFFMCVFASLEFNTVFSSNAHVCEIKIPQSSPVGARSFE